MKQFINLTIAGVIIAIISTQCTPADNGGETQISGGINTSYIKTAVHPGDNFFQYANGAWLDSAKIPDDKTTYGSFNELSEKNKEALQKLIDTIISSNPEKGTPAQKIKDFYLSGMDTTKINAKKFEDIQYLLDDIRNLETIEDVKTKIGQLHKQGLSAVFYLYGAQDEKSPENVVSNIMQSGLGLPDRDYYLADAPSIKPLQDAYKKHLNNLFVLLGYNEEEAANAAEKVYEMEKELAANSMSRVAMRDPDTTYNKMTIDELNAKTPNFDWKAYFSTLGLDENGTFIIGQPEFLAGFDKMLSSFSAADWKLYLERHLIGDLAPYLHAEIVNEYFSFYGVALSGLKKLRPRWQRVQSTINGSLGEEVGKLYVKEFFTPEAKAKAKELVLNLKASLAERIDKLAWMEDATKQKAKDKLAAMNIKIGYPDKWKDYSGLEITPDSYVKNALASTTFARQENLNKIGKPVDKDEWFLSPQTINAYYHPTLNEIVFPAAILQPPFFDVNADDASNYGAIGCIIGHEMTHGFDDQGRKYNLNGMREDWWTKKDEELFTKNADLIVKQFDDFIAVDSMHINGSLTLGENIADLGGITISYNAFKKTEQGQSENKINGYTPDQRFFISYAQAWRKKIRDEAMKMAIKTDVHSPAPFRVNGPLYNIDAFYKAFEITEDKAFYRAENNRPMIW